jgi:hypothetical protein
MLSRIFVTCLPSTNEFISLILTLKYPIPKQLLLSFARFETFQKQSDEFNGIDLRVCSECKYITAVTAAHKT